MNEIVVDGRAYTKASEDYLLEKLLLQHLGLDRVEQKKIVLSDMQLLTLKSWLVAITESTMPPGTYTCAEHGARNFAGGPMEVVFARGKKKNGEVVLWHEPLPWPGDWEKERVTVMAPPTVKLAKIDNDIVLTYSHITARFNKLQIEKLIDALNTRTLDEQLVVEFNGGKIEIEKFDENGSFRFETESPMSSLTTSFQHQEIAWMVETIETLTT
jgi:hypothetical protein